MNRLIVYSILYQTCVPFFRTFVLFERTRNVSFVEDFFAIYTEDGEHIMTNCQKGKVNQLLHKAGLPVHNAMLFAFMPHLLHFENVAIYIYTAWPNNS